MKQISWVFFSWLVLLLSSAQAASFDCAKAAARVEKLICGDAELSKLDEELNTAYKAALQDEISAKSIRLVQKQWLRDRNRCADADCLKRSYKSRLTKLSPAASANQLSTTPPWPAMADENPPQQFQLMKGADIPVCEDYLKRLNQMEFDDPLDDPPYCDRPESTAVEGFSLLNRVFLSAEEVYALTPRVSGFSRSKNQDYYDQQNQMGKKFGWPPQELMSLNSIKGDIGREIKVWRYAPPIDIDNDGTPDPLIVWHGLGAGHSSGRCGGRDYREGIIRQRQTQIAYLMDPAMQRIDEARTQTIFGHPLGGYLVTYKDPNTGHRVTEYSENFRPIGLTVGIFSYQGEAYFDTFFDEWGDFKGKRRTRPEIQDTLGVFLRKGAVTQQICEYLWNDPEKTQTKINHRRTK